MSENRTNGTTPPADDLRSLIAAATAENTRPDPPPAKNEPPAKPSETEPPPAGQPGEGAPGEGQPPGEGPPETPPAAEAPGDGQTGERIFREGPPRAGPATPETATAPVTWAQADKDKFNALPAEAKAPFLDLYKAMQGGFTQKLQRGAQLEKDYGEADRQIFTAEQRRVLAEKGVTVPGLINAWAGVERSLASPAARDDIIARIIHNYQGDPGAIARRLNELRGFAAPPAGSGDATGTAPNGGEPPVRSAVDPQLAARIERLETEHSARKLADDTARQAAAQQIIDNFANMVDDVTGQLAHPFYAEVVDEMTGLAQLDRAMGKHPDIADLYTRAVWANPATREKQLALQRDAERQRQADDRKRQAEQARRAGSSITGAPGPGTQSTNATSDLSLRDQIKATMTNGGRPETSGGRGRI